MSNVRIHSFSLSIDGFGAGAEQSLDDPLGAGGPEMFDWFFKTRTFQQMHGGEGGSTGIDDTLASRGFENVGAWILGRNMFGPVRGPWPDETWRGWWGDTPPYHCDAFVLTHHARDPIAMKGGTTFHFVTDGIEAALKRARASAGSKDVRIGGGVATIRQYLQAGSIDSIHLAMTAAILGRGESLLAGIDMKALGFTCTERTAGENATHVVLTKAT